MEDRKLKALYFPHTDVTNPVILKNALLLWDDVETMVPERRWVPRRDGLTDEMREAAELVVKHRVPRDSERRAAHQAVVKLVEDGTVTSLIGAPKVPGQYRYQEADYLIYPDKFLQKTWRQLEERGLARWVDNAQDYGVPPALGFLMMSILADACAGTQIQKLTDRADAYNWISATYAKALKSQLVTSLDASQVAPAYDRLVTLSLEVLDARAIPLERLIAMRKRELAEGGHDYSDLRRRYLKTLQLFLKRISTDAKTPGDLRELERQFKEDIKGDLRTLKQELRIAGVKSLLSKEVGLAALLIGGTLTAPLLGVTSLPMEISGLGVIPLGKAALELGGTRKEILRKHNMSWLYLGSKAIHSY